MLSDGRPAPMMPVPVAQRAHSVTPVPSPQRSAAPASPAYSSAASNVGAKALAVNATHTRSIVNQDARAMLNHLQTCPGGVNAIDAAGWSCLHWAALDGKEEHVAALLDSGAEVSLVTAQPIADENVSSGVREAGTTAATLARFPSEGGKGHTRVVKLLSAAERGAFRLRREHKERGDAAMVASDFAKAVEEYERVLGAVLQLEDTAAMTVRSALSMAEEAVQRQEEKALKTAEITRQAERRKREEDEAAEEERRVNSELALRVLRDAESALTDEGGGQDHVGLSLQTIEPLMRVESCADDVRDFLWRVSSRLQGQLLVSEARSTQRADDLADLEVSKSTLNMEIGTARGEVEALTLVVAQRAEESVSLKRARAEAAEGLERLEKDMARIREDCSNQLQVAQEREETLRAERRTQDAAMEALKDVSDDLRVQLTTANAQLSSLEQEASDQRVNLTGGMAAKEAELASAHAVSSTLESKVEEALAGAEKALEQAAVWQTKAEDEARNLEATKRELVAAGNTTEEAKQDAQFALEELRKEHEADTQKQLYAVASAKDEHSAMLDEMQAAATQRAEEAAQLLVHAEQVTEQVRAELSEEVVARAGDKVAAEQALEVQAATAARAQTKLQAMTKQALGQKEAEMMKARDNAIDSLTKCKMERDSSEVALADAEKQLETHREEAAQTLRKLGDAQDGFKDERAMLVQAVQDAERAAIDAKDAGERDNTELKEQAGWRETLRKKVEERCVKLEETVATFTTSNGQLTQQLAKSSASLAKAEAKASEAEERAAVVEAEVGSARALVTEAEGAVADLKRAAAAEVKAARQGRTAMADQLEQLQGELSAATHKVGEGWSQQITTSAAVEEATSQLRDCKEQLGSRELELEQAKDALAKADAARGKLRTAHEAELKELSAEGTSKTQTLLAEIADLRAKLDASKHAAAEADEATSAKDAELDSTAVARSAAELRANQRGVTITEQGTALAEASKEAQGVANKAIEELTVVMAARQAAEREAETLKSEAEALVDARRAAEDKAETATKEAREAVESRRAAERRETAARSREDGLEGRLTELEQAWKDDLSRAQREQAALTDIILGKQGCPTLEELQAEAAEAKGKKEKKADRTKVGNAPAGRGKQDRSGSKEERSRDRAAQVKERSSSNRGGGSGGSASTGSFEQQRGGGAAAAARRERAGRKATRPVSSSSSDGG